MTTSDVRSCEDALRLLAAHLDGELETHTRAEVERHLSTCRSCYSRAEFERLLKEQLAGAGRAEVRPELAARIRDLIDGFTPTASD